MVGVVRSVVPTTPTTPQLAGRHFAAKRVGSGQLAKDKNVSRKCCLPIVVLVILGRRDGEEPKREPEKKKKESYSSPDTYHTLSP